MEIYKKQTTDKHVRKKKITKIKKDNQIIDDELEIANCINESFAKLGLYKGKKLS